MKLDTTYVEVEKPKEFLEKLDAIDNEIKALLSQVEQLGEEGKIEESEAVAAQAELLKQKKEELKLSGDPNMSSNLKQMKVCEICGAMQTINDTEKRTQTHLEGKLHTGFAMLRKELETLRKRKEELRNLSLISVVDKEDKKKEKPKKKSASRSHSRNRERSRDKRKRDDSKSKRKPRKSSQSPSENKHSRKSRSRSRSKDRKHRKDKRSRSRSKDRKRKSQREKSKEKQRHEENPSSSHFNAHNTTGAPGSQDQRVSRENSNLGGNSNTHLNGTVNNASTGH